MSRVVGDIAVSVGADVGPLQREMQKGSRAVKGFGKDAAAVAARMAKVGAAISAAFVAVGYGVFKAVDSAASLGAEIEKLSRIAGATPEEFQRLAYAANTVGIGQEKLADILKDVQDRVGDFLQTGGGPMADFFENIAPKVGVTAEQFKNLSGPQALQLFVSSLERANLSQSEMTFYLEAMASDLTQLQPILADGGKEAKKLGDRITELGGVMSDEAVYGSQELKAELDALGTTIKTKIAEAILNNKDTIIAVIESLNEWIPRIAALVEALGGVANAIGAIVDGLKEWKKWTQFGGNLDFLENTDRPALPSGNAVLPPALRTGPQLPNPLSPAMQDILLGGGGTRGLAGGAGGDAFGPTLLRSSGVNEFAQAIEAAEQNATQAARAMTEATAATQENTSAQTSETRAKSAAAQATRSASSAVEGFSKSMTATERRAQELAEQMSNELGYAFSSVIQGSSSVGDALTQLGNNILNNLAQDIFSRTIGSTISTGLSGIIGGIIPGLGQQPMGPKVNVFNNTPAQVSVAQSPQGLDIIMKDVTRGVASNIMAGGEVATAINKAYQIRPGLAGR